MSPTRTLALALAGVLLGAGPAGAAPEAFQLVVPPGQERRLGAMVGMGDVPFPGGCRLESAATVKSVVRLRYLCGTEQRALALVLHPPTFVGDALARTEEFALTADEEAAPPAGFVDALAARLRAGEGRWHWMKVRGDHQAAASHLLPTPPPVAPAGDQAELDPRHVEVFERGAALYREQRHAEALALFVEIARENPRFGGVLGMIVANLAPTRPDAAAVAAYVEAAEAAPEDLLASFVAGVSAHYSAHYIAATAEEKQRLYETCIRLLERTRPTFEFEPRVFIYLAVSHYRLGHQAKAEALIERAVEIAEHDPDAYYCRAEIFHREDVERSLADLETYLEMTRRFAAAGGWAADEKVARVEAMRAYLRRVQAGDDPLEEIFDPLASDTPGTHAPLVPGASESSPSPPPPSPPSEAARAMASPRTYLRWVLYAAVALGLVLGAVALAARRRRRAPPA